MYIDDLLSLTETYSKEQKAWVLYKFPQADTVFLMAQNDDRLHYFDAHTPASGFLLSPFNQGKRVLLSNDRLFECKITVNQPLSVCKTQLQESLSEKQRYCSLIEKAILRIQQKEFKKVVLSRKIEVPVSDSIHLGGLFNEMIHRYPEAFCYAFSHPRVGNWAAATPETLIRVENRYFSTMALAATQVFSPSIQWKSKEIEEQDIVNQSITSKIQSLTQSLNISETKTVKAGYLAHLCTPIHGEILPEVSPFTLIERLHPTPAVCGFPTQKALQFIINEENYQRAFYSGYCGTIFYRDNLPKIDLFVNLRCLSLAENKASIYVGGGITAHSIPEKEWEETQNKAQIMFSLLKLN